MQVFAARRNPSLIRGRPFRRSIRIRHAAEPQNPPADPPSKCDLVVNLKNTKALVLNICGSPSSPSEMCKRNCPERHECKLYLAVESIDHSRSKTKSPQTNGICERFHKTVLNEFYRVAFRKKVCRCYMSCRPISICGSVNTMSNALINNAGASGKPRRRASWMPCPSRRRK